MGAGVRKGTAMNSSAYWLWWLLPAYSTAVGCMVVLRRIAARAIAQPATISDAANAHH